MRSAGPRTQARGGVHTAPAPSAAPCLPAFDPGMPECLLRAAKRAAPRRRPPGVSGGHLDPGARVALRRPGSGEAGGPG